MLLSKEALKAIQDRRVKVVTLDKWDLSVRLKQMSALDMSELNKKRLAQGNDQEMMAFMLEMCALHIVDENDARIFVTDEDRQLLSEKNPELIIALFEEINKLGQDEKPDAEPVSLEDRAKNSQEIQDDSVVSV